MTRQMIGWLMEAVGYRRGYMDEVVRSGQVVDIAKAQQESWTLVEIWEDSAKRFDGALADAFLEAAARLDEVTRGIAHDRRCHYYWDAERDPALCMCHDVDWVALGVTL